ncbi:MAG: hypothetical protein ABRQ37_22855 [Candidatus Eremiobacterota bacterium]
MENPGLLEKISEYTFKGLFAVIIIIGGLAFILLTIASIDKFLDIFVDIPKDTMGLLFTLIGPLGILIVGGLCLDMAKTVYDQEIKSLPLFGKKKKSEEEEEKMSVAEEFPSTEKTNRFVSRFIAIVVTFLVVEFSTIAFQYQNRPDAGIDIILLVKAGLSLIGAAVLLLMWSLFLKD